MSADAASSPTLPLLEARRVGRRHPTAGGWLLERIDLALLPGEKVAIEGPPGSGKTLLLRTLALLDPVDEGEVLLKGEVPGAGDTPSFRSRVLYLHQTPALVGGTVEDNLRLPFSFKIRRPGPPFSQRRVAGILQALDLDAAFCAKPVEHLSGGESQIVAFVRALVVEPAVLLLDEPTSALDAASRAVVEELVSAWQQEGPHDRACIWVSHDREQTRRMGGRRLVLRDGRIVEEAPA